MLWEEKLFVTGQDNASEETFFLIHLVFQRDLGLRKGGQKNTKKVSRII
jgi:hypothetical protein